MSADIKAVGGVAAGILVTACLGLVGLTATVRAHLPRATIDTYSIPRAAAPAPVATIESQTAVEAQALMASMLRVSKLGDTVCALTSDASLRRQIADIANEMRAITLDSEQVRQAARIRLGWSDEVAAVETLGGSWVPEKRR